MTEHRSRILIVDDDEQIRQICKTSLEKTGHEVQVADDGLSAEALMESRQFELVLSDLQMPRIGGMELLDYIISRHPDTIVVMFTGHGSIDLAKEAILKGAFEFLTKPFRLKELNETVSRALEAWQHRISDMPSRELSLLYDLTAYSTHVSSENEFLDNIAGVLLQSFRADAVRIYLFTQHSSLFSDSTSDELLPITLQGADELIDDDVWTSLTLRTLSSDYGFVLSDAAKDPLLEGRGSGTVMSQQIPGEHKPIGAITIVRTNTPGSFTPRDLKILSLFAAQTSNYLINHLMAEKLKYNAEELEQINTLASTFSSTLSVEFVLKAIGSGLLSRFAFDIFGVAMQSKNEEPFAYCYQRNDIIKKHEKIFWDTMKSEMKEKELYQARENVFRETFQADAKAKKLSDSIRAKVIIQLSEFAQIDGLIVVASFSEGGFHPDTGRFLSTLAGQAATAILNAHLHHTNDKNYFETIAAFARAVDAKDRYTHYHSRNVAAYSLAITDFLALSETDRNNILSAALMHDIGKIGIPEAILNKRGSLTDEEYMMIKTHPEIGYQILSRVAAFKDIVPAVRSHHERFDGKGYPDGISKLSIPVYARILCVSDAFDSMTSDRVYRPAPGLEYAVEELRENAGKQFDPDFAYALVEILTDRTPEEILDHYSTETD